MTFRFQTDGLTAHEYVFFLFVRLQQRFRVPSRAKSRVSTGSDPLFSGSGTTRAYGRAGTPILAN